MPQSARITVMMGGWQQEELLNLSEEELYKVALKNLSFHFKQSLAPDVHIVTKRHQAIPQYFLGHQEGVDKLELEYNSFPISFIGSSFKGVSVSDCVSQAKKASELIAPL